MKPMSYENYELSMTPLILRCNSVNATGILKPYPLTPWNKALQKLNPKGMGWRR